MTELQQLAHIATRALAKEDYVEAYKHYKTLLKRGAAQNVDILLGAAICQFRLSLYEKCLTTIGTITAIAPNHLRATILSADCHYKINPMSDQHKILYTKAHALAGENPDADVKASISKGYNRIALTDKRKELELPNSNNKEASQRFDQSLSINYGEHLVYQQNPSLFYFPNVVPIEFFEASTFPQLRQLEINYPTIKSELERSLNDISFAPYLESSPKSRDEKSKKLIKNEDWSAAYLWKNGQEITENTSRFPQTSEILREISTANIAGRSPNILFSKLKPNTHIPPHTGLLNTRLICHLPLIVPIDCGGIRCGNQIKHWDEGKVLIFDDSIEHEAWNCSDQNRIVLIFEIWRPDISAKERELITRLIEVKATEGQ